MIKRILPLAVALVFLSGCTLYQGGMLPSASLSENNFHYVHHGIRGESQATYYVGVGGMKRDALVAEARQAMLAEHPLQDGQALVNVTVDYRQTSIIFQLYRRVTCIVTADVVQFK
ncbi:MAG: DUF6567 family protein [Flavobacteriales bacterium]|nr:hypothetical protein [Flavobacteriales bacterium]MCB9201382.1 hypothetical protein [Flavobacteriales bacterium]HOP43797.1 hypothetical protein [Flavobacteriales bacterium]HPF68647.1 hypothetical protein [Flavobacteriales bacterium]